MIIQQSSEIRHLTTDLIGTKAVAPRRQGVNANCRIRAVYTIGDMIMALVAFNDGKMRIHELLELHLYSDEVRDG